MKKVFFLLISLFIIPSVVFSQDDLMDLLNEETKNEKAINFTTATFKGTRLINGHSVELPAGGVLVFLIGHRFGEINDGPYEFFGLDNATIRLGLDYGIHDRIAIGIGRSSFEKTLDGFAKFKLLRQSTGARNMPFSAVYFTSIAMNGLKWADPERNNFFSSRLAFTHQLLIARKFTDSFSFQLMPTFVHLNLVPTTLDKNDVLAVGAGFRQKITKRISVNGEYYYTLPDQVVTNQIFNSASVGFDIETGGHVFQLHFTNSKGMIEKFFVTQTTSDWGDGGIFFGFNISRVFTLDRKSKKK